MSSKMSPAIEGISLKQLHAKLKVHTSNPWNIDEPRHRIHLLFPVPCWAVGLEVSGTLLLP